MSIPVPLAELAEAMGRYGFAYLLTADGGRPHAVAVTPVIDGEDLVTSAGRRTCAHASAQPEVALVWPPTEAGGYSLIVDGTASVSGEQVRIRPSHAVLHRPADHAGATVAGACGNDCVPVEL